MTLLPEKYSWGSRNTQVPTVVRRGKVPRDTLVPYSSEPRRAGARTGATMDIEPLSRTHPRCRASRWRCASSRWTSRRETSRPTTRRPSASGCAVQALGSGRLAVSDASTWNTEESAFDHVYGAFERTKGGVVSRRRRRAQAHARASRADVGPPALDARGGGITSACWLWPTRATARDTPCAATTRFHKPQTPLGRRTVCFLGSWTTCSRASRRNARWQPAP